jgi:hypothetical protein
MKSETTIADSTRVAAQIVAITQQGINVMMESTVTQNSALYFAQHKNWAPRAEFFRRFRFGARKRRLAGKAATMGELFFWARLHGEGRTLSRR